MKPDKKNKATSKRVDASPGKMPYNDSGFLDSLQCSNFIPSNVLKAAVGLVSERECCFLRVFICILNQAAGISLEA